MDGETYGCAGICETDGQGNVIKLEREYFRQGWVFKDWGHSGIIRMHRVMCRNLMMPFIRGGTSWNSATARKRPRRACEWCGKMMEKPVLTILNENREENAIMKKKERNAGCEHCANLVPIGEGDHICYECGRKEV